MRETFEQRPNRRLEIRAVARITGQHHGTRRAAHVFEVGHRAIEMMDRFTRGDSTRYCS